jgi:hypothetical protein
MALLVNNAALQQFLDAITAHISAAMAVQCRLYVNNVTPGHTDVPAFFTEASWAGYSPISLGTWAPSGLSGLTAQAFLNVFPTWFNTTGSPVSVYGYFITDAGNSVVYWAERDPNAVSGPIVLNPGDSYTPNIQLTYLSEF